MTRARIVAGLLITVVFAAVVTYLQDPRFWHRYYLLVTQD